MEQDKAIRAKIVASGAGSLTDAELLAILLDGGVAGESALSTAENVLHEAGGLAGLSRAGAAGLRQTAGIGMKRAASLTAALELGRRAAGRDAAPVVISGNDDIENIFRPRLAPLKHEEFWALYLSSANTVLGEAKVSQGGVSLAAVDPRLIVKRALELLASSIVLVHNHPSGIAEPSPEDISLTEKISAAAALFDIAVTDHVIIAEGGCYSFRVHRLIV